MARRRTFSRLNCVVRVVAAVVVMACVCVGGCAAPNFRGDGFRNEDEAFQWLGRQRTRDYDSEAFGFSNKARDIESDFGIR